MTSNDYLSLVASMTPSTKYSRWYQGIIKTALSRAVTRKAALKLLNGYCEGHHILPKSFGQGGDTDANNIVFLSAREHLLVHILLGKMFVSGKHAASVHSALAYFQKRSKNHKGDCRLTSWKFEQLRVARAVAARLNNIRPINIDGIDYESAEHAAGCLGIKKATIHYRANSSSFPSYVFTDKQTPKIVRKRYRNTIEVDGVEYESVEVARKLLGLNRCEIDARLRDINYPTYKSMNETIVKTNRTPMNTTKKIIVIDGVKYDSVRDAARQTGIDRSTIKGRVNSIKFDNYQALTNLITI